MHIFIDESGQLSRNGDENYFVIAAFAVDDFRRTEKAFKAWCGSRFPKRMQRQPEIKWSSSGMDESLRLRTLKFISGLGIQIRYVYLLNKNIPNTYNGGNKFKEGLLYSDIVKSLIDLFLPTDNSEIHIFCDQRRLQGMTSSAFIEKTKNHLIDMVYSKTKIQVDILDSTNSSNIQIADWIAGAVWKYKESKEGAQKYFDILSLSKLFKGKEIFPDQGKS